MNSIPKTEMWRWLAATWLALSLVFSSLGIATSVEARAVETQPTSRQVELIADGPRLEHRRDNLIDDSEAVYPLTVDPWVQRAKLLPSDAAENDWFGGRVAISGDAGVLVVGAAGDDDNGDHSGSVYVFVEPEGGWSGIVTQSAKLLPSDAAESDWFGDSVAISGDAGVVVVGTWGDDDNGANSGSTYVFVEPEGGWSGTLNESAKLLPSDGAESDFFGYSVAISDDAGAVVVGAWGDDDNGAAAGSAYIFEKPEGGWSGMLNESAKLLPSDGAGKESFGCSVAISGDTLVVGVEGDDDNGVDSGSTYVFVEPESGWSGTLNESAKLLPSDGMEENYFGNSVAISGDAGAIVIGSYGGGGGEAFSGSAYVFVEPEGGWSGALNESAKLLPNIDATWDYFGNSVAISGDAGTIVIGAYGADGNQAYSGSAYVFMKPEGGWWGALNESAKLLPSDGVTWDYFGASVSISGDADAIVVGAPADDDNGYDTGSAYVFGSPLPDLAITKAVTPSTVAPGDTLTYTLSFTAPALDVRLWDPLPANVRLVPGSLTSTLTPAAVYSPTTHAIIWNGRPPTDTVSTVRFQVTPEVSGTGSLSLILPIINTVWLTDTTYDRSVSATVIVNGWCVYLPIVMR
jgi:uncharacterized repeat protein (TIGR01451 family)